MASLCWGDRVVCLFQGRCGIDTARHDPWDEHWLKALGNVVNRSPDPTMEDEPTRVFSLE